MFNLRQMTILAIVTTYAALNPNAAFSQASSPCAAPEMLLARDEIRHAASLGAEPKCYRLDLASPGLLHLDVATDSSNGARLEIHPARPAGEKRPGHSQELTAVVRSASEFLLFAGPGAYFIEVHAEDPQQPTPAHRLASRFVETAKSETDGELDLEPEKSETDGELDLEPEKSETDGELDLEPEKSDGCQSIRPWLERLCQTGDDYGDSLACSTHVDSPVSGELENGWGDDVDTFRFEVSEWQSVEIDAVGELDFRGSLYDARGQRLAEVASEDGILRLARAFGPGTYLLRLQGASGAYALNVTAR